MPLFHENTYFHFKLSRAYFEGFFRALCSRCRARRGLLEAENLTFSIFRALCPVVVPAEAFWEPSGTTREAQGTTREPLGTTTEPPGTTRDH